MRKVKFFCCSFTTSYEQQRICKDGLQIMVSKGSKGRLDMSPNLNPIGNFWSQVVIWAVLGPTGEVFDL